VLARTPYLAIIIKLSWLLHMRVGNEAGAANLMLRSPAVVDSGTSYGSTCSDICQSDRLTCCDALHIVA
jgi:hypothetical protein